MTIIVLVVSITISFLIAHYLGTKRKIGFGWSLFFCIFLSPIIGGIITLLSPKEFNDNNPSKAIENYGTFKIIVGVFLIVTGMASVIRALVMLDYGIERSFTSPLESLMFGTGILGLGVYLLPITDTKKSKNSTNELNKIG